MAGFCVRRPRRFSRTHPRRTTTGSRTTTTGWSSTINTFVADLAEFCIITVRFEISRYFARFGKRNSTAGVRIVRMWEKFSLRTRLFLPLGMMFVAALVLGAVSLRLFAPVQLIEENEPATRSAKVVAEALNSALKTPPIRNRRWMRSCNRLEHPRLSSSGASEPMAPPARRSKSEPRSDRCRGWFVDLIGVPDIGASFPVTIEGRRVGDIVFVAGYFRRHLREMDRLSGHRVRRRRVDAVDRHYRLFRGGCRARPAAATGRGAHPHAHGRLRQLIHPSGPPEIRKSSEEANELARTLNRLSQDNRNLLRKDRLAAGRRTPRHGARTS